MLPPEPSAPVPLVQRNDDDWISFAIDDDKNLPEFNQHENRHPSPSPDVCDTPRPQSAPPMPSVSILLPEDKPEKSRRRETRIPVPRRLSEPRTMDPRRLALLEMNDQVSDEDVVDENVNALTLNSSRFVPFVLKKVNQALESGPSKVALDKAAESLPPTLLRRLQKKVSKSLNVPLHEKLYATPPQVSPKLAAADPRTKPLATKRRGLDGILVPSPESSEWRLVRAPRTDHVTKSTFGDIIGVDAPVIWSPDLTDDARPLDLPAIKNKSTAPVTENNENSDSGWCTVGFDIWIRRALKKQMFL